VLDTASRHVKGRKIERLLGPVPVAGGLRLLEIGCGGGGISAYFAAQRRFDVTAVDVVDQRQVRDGYRFVRVDGVVLPFHDGEFDIVLSNHVIEHVGDRHQQRDHLRELARVLRPGGVAYLAVPNRWAPLEPHFRVPFLSWPPRRLRTPYLKAVRGTDYDCEPLGPRELDAMLRSAALASESIEDEALQAMLDLGELGPLTAACVRSVPRRVRRLLRPAMPTLIRRLHHA
jgi:SAM-dependent methyltransferase